MNFELANIIRIFRILEKSLNRKRNPKIVKGDPKIVKGMKG